jgi:two-component system, cell cycle sensor histidine kinase and response regulator CckA
MEKTLRILIVEDTESDAEMVKRVIGKEGIDFVDRIVETKDDFINALSEFSPDLIISDYSMPQFTGMKALLLRQELAPQIPFVLVTGSMNEDVAVECMKAGADDYVIKQNLIRLVPALKAAMLKQETIKLRQDAETALRESEKKFRNLYTNMAEGVCLHKLVYDDNGKPVNYRIVGVNHQYAQILNIRQVDVVGKLATEIYGENVPPYFEKYVQVVIEEKSFIFETYYTPLDKYFLISVSPWDNDGFATIFTDITARKQAEDSIRKERILLRTLIDNLPSTIYAKDIEGRKLLANLTDLEVIGVTSEAEIIGKTDLEIFKNETGERGYADDLSVLQTGQPVINREEDFIDRNGNHRWFQTSKLPLFDEHGLITGLVGIGHDITERKYIEEELRKLSRAVEQSSVSIVITDLAGNIEYVNPKFTDLTGYTREEVIGANPKILQSGGTPKESYKQLWDTIMSGGQWHGEFQNKKKNGEIYFESALISPISDETGRITHFLATKEDITSRKRTEEEIRQKVEELAISNDELSRFNRLAIGREMRMIEIKKYCNNLAVRLGIEEPYPLAFLKDNTNMVSGRAETSAGNEEEIKRN